MATDVPTTIDPQSGCAIDSKFLCVVSTLRLTCPVSIQVFVWCIFETRRGRKTHVHFNVCTDIPVEISRGDPENQVDPSPVG